MSNANLAITTAGQADSSLAMILATAGAMIDEINPAMKTIKEGLKGNVLKTVMGPYGTTDDAAQQAALLRNRHQRIRLRLQQEEELGHRISAVALTIPMPAREHVVRSLWEVVQNFVERYDSEVYHEVQQKFGEAIAYIDPDARFAAIDSYVLQAQQAIILSVQKWDAMQGAAASGRVAFAKARDAVITAYHAAVEKLTDSFSARQTLEHTLSLLNESSQVMLQQAQGDLSLLSVTKINELEGKRKFVLDQLKNLDQRMVSTSGPIDKKTYVPLKVPRELTESLQGQELQIAMDTFMEINSHKYYVIPAYIARVGGDVDPIKGLFWRCPDAADGYSAVPAVFRERYREESRNLWMELNSSQHITSSIIMGITSPFNVGVAGDQVGQCAIWDGVSAYWALLSKYRPLDAAYRQDVELYLDSAHTGFRKFDGRLLDTVQAVMKRIAEAKMLGIRIKWHKTGEQWVSHLSTRPNYAVALQDFLKAPVDPDDCVLTLEQLLRVIEQTAVREYTTADVNIPLYSNQAMCVHDTANPEQGHDWSTGGWMEPRVPNPEHLAAMYTGAGMDGEAFAIGNGWRSYAEQGKGRKGKSKGDHAKGDSYVVPGARLRLAQERAHGFSRAKGKGYGGRGHSSYSRHGNQGAYAALDINVAGRAWDVKLGCFCTGCPANKFQKFDLCLTCHKAGLERGQVLCRDGKTYALLPVQNTKPDDRKAAMLAIAQAAKIYRESFAGAITMVDDHQQDADVCQLLQDMADMEDAGYGRCDEALHLQVLDDVKPDGPHKRVAPAEDIRANKRTCDEARHHENAMIAALNKLSQHCSK